MVQEVRAKHHCTERQQPISTVTIYIYKAFFGSTRSTSCVRHRFVGTYATKPLRHRIYQNFPGSWSFSRGFPGFPGSFWNSRGFPGLSTPCSSSVHSFNRPSASSNWRSTSNRRVSLSHPLLHEDSGKIFSSILSRLSFLALVTARALAEGATSALPCERITQFHEFGYTKR